MAPRAGGSAEEYDEFLQTSSDDVRALVVNEVYFRYGRFDEKMEESRAVRSAVATPSLSQSRVL